MSTIAQSSRNPFRNPAITSTATGSSQNSSSSSSQVPVSSLASTPTGNSISTTSASTASPNDVLNEELPPAYTAAPDSSHGEQTVEYGPRRPFQNPPARPAPPQHPQSTGWTTVQNHVVHSPPPPSQPQSFWPSQTPPAPIEPPTLPPRPSRDASQASPTSEFARDFYAAGAGPPPRDNDESAQYPPPPPGPPPTGSQRSSDDDGRPTKTPVPGHPLLNHGRLLVYPPGYECDKCRNVGYKQNDPSNPCRKCWSKYAKPFSGAITYSSFKSSSAGSGKTFQRPLPSLHPPQAARPQNHSGYPGSSYAQNVGQGQNPHTTRPPSGSYPPQSQPPHPPAPNIQMVPGGYSPYGPPGPPPGSIVYTPGDPRLGGRLCWRCDGDGLIGGFLFQEQCPACGGIGRTYNWR
ncbi:hypothetical protein FB446DRAFT_637853 [Lentinula raphanica]|nr:hypothetical protein FB446DRAFT_637853 [Lentinula raphanica]